MATRKDARNLTSTEKADFVRAVKGVKANGIYDQFVLWHQQAGSLTTILPGEPDTPTYRNAAHRGPAFHPWHREMLRRFELELQQIVPGVAIPYWNWSRDAANPSGAAVWAADLMGGNGVSNRGWVVRTGPFSQQSGWTIIDGNGQNAGPLRRRFGEQSPGISGSSAVDRAVREVPYDDPPLDGTSNSRPSHRNRLEGWLVASPRELHNQVHRWVGQSMLPLTSPNDPVFYLHHCNVDRLWGIWQSRNPSQGYLPTSNGPPRHNLNDSMYIWDVTPASVLNITNLGYDYA